MMKKVIVVSSILSLSGAMAFAAEPSTQQQPAAGGVTVSQRGNTGMEAVNTVEVTAKVVGVDKKKRELRLKTQDGNETTIHAGDEVRNFDQIKKGDTLRVSYLESLTWDIKKGSDAPITITRSEDVTRSAPGQKPGGVASEKITARGVVTKLDKKAQTVTVKGPARTVVLQVPKPDVFNNIKVGDKIEATYTEALAVSIESVKK